MLPRDRRAAFGGEIDGAARRVREAPELVERRIAFLVTTGGGDDAANRRANTGRGSSEQQPIDDRERDRVHADPDCQRQDSRQREQRPVPQLPNRDASVVKQLPTPNSQLPAIPLAVP